MGKLLSTGWRVALVVLVLGFLVRGIASFVIVPAWEARAGVAPFPDRYPAMARCLLSDATLAFSPDCDAPTTTRGPGFPLWLSIGMILGGPGSAWLGFWSSLPEVLTAAALSCAAFAHLGRIPALLGGLILAVHPFPALQSARSFSDGWYASLAFLTILLLWKLTNENSPSLRLLLVSSTTALLTLHLLTRTSGIVTLAAIGLAVLLNKRQTQVGFTQRGVLTASAVITVALLSALAWSVRTSELEGRPVYLHSLLYYNYWVGVAHDRDGLGTTAGETWRFEKARIRRAASPESGPLAQKPWYDLTPAEAARLEKELRSAARRDVLDHPGEFALRTLRGLGRFWFQARTASRSAQYAVLNLPIALLALGGCVFATRLRGEARFVSQAAALLVLLHMAAYAVTAPAAKFSIQVWPAAAWLAGLAMAMLVKFPDRMKSVETTKKPASQAQRWERPARGMGSSGA